MTNFSTFAPLYRMLFVNENSSLSLGRGPKVRGILIIHAPHPVLLPEGEGTLTAYFLKNSIF